MVSQPPPTEVGLVFESLEASSRVAQLEAEIAQLKDALASGSRSEWRPGGPALRPSPRADLVTAGTRLPNGHVKVRNIAQAIINAHCGRLSPTEVEILSVIELHMPDGVRLIVARVDGQRPTSESSQ